MKHPKCLNTMPIKRNVFLLLFLLASFKVSATVDYGRDSYPLNYLQRNLSLILVNDNISPPMASRVYMYSHMASYCILMNEDKKNICSSVKDFPVINLSAYGKKYLPSLAASFAFFQVAEKMIYTVQPFRDSFAVLQNWYRNQGITPDVFQQSKKVGMAVAQKIINWMNTDRFNETRKMNKYVLLKTPGKWQLTSPGYFPAVEPHWGEIRPLLLTDRKELDKLLPIPFDTSRKSFFYKEADTLYKITTRLSDEQKLIASFWDCNPFALKPVGHINLIDKKISPGGHWMNIAAIASHSKGLDIKQTSQVFTRCAIALFDAFIYTWDKKYQYSYLRPETFIQQNGIDNNWKPFIQSPPFPEFPSGHAVVSNAAASVLTGYFGADFTFIDDTEIAYGLAPRKFNSFLQAADEATISRVYGGIHFIFSCFTGQQMGKLIGDKINRQFEKTETKH